MFQLLYVTLVPIAYEGGLDPTASLDVVVKTKILGGGGNRSPAI
jgi:hypothetical protein